jgi:mono/diheme cytochrome c family protein
MRMRQNVRLGSVPLFALLAGCGGDRRGDGVTPQTADAGRVTFEKFCAACHGVDGTGSETGIPPLAGSAWVRGPQSRLIRIVLHGLRGPIDVGAATYNLEMPGFGPVVSDAETAAVLTYIRSRFGRRADRITAETVGKVRRATRDRTTYWTAQELLAVP